MPETRKQHLLYTFLTVLITVPCFVYYCSSYENGGFNIDIIKESSIYIPIELVLAFLSSVFLGNPIAQKIASKVVDFQKSEPILIELAIIASTAFFMCPWMSFLATILYDGIIDCGLQGASFANFMVNLIPYWLQKVVLNFPFALLMQVFIIQPLVKRIFKILVKPATAK